MSTIRLRLSLVLLFAISFYSAVSQSTENGQVLLRNHNPIPQNPNATAMIRYGEIPVGHYSGTASISVPIHTIKVKSFELPIALTYNTSGIRVADEAGPVGLGWSISLGGMITQAVNDRNDLPDNEFTDFEYINSPDVPGHDDLGDYDDFNCTDGDIFIPNISIWHTFNGPGNMYQQSLGYYNAQGDCDPSVHPTLVDPFDNETSTSSDTEPDYFHYSFGQHSGKFFWDNRLDKFLTLDRNAMKITYVPTAAQQQPGWIIVTEDGTTYRFFQAERHRGISSPISLSGGGGTTAPYFSNYQLTSIKLVTGEEINFTYTQGPLVCLLAGYSESASGLVDVDEISMQYGESLSQHGYIPNFLSEITFPAGKVVFTWGNRLDILNDRKLEKVEVYNSLNEKIKTVDFDNTQYFQGSLVAASNRPNFTYANGGPNLTCDCSAAGLTEDGVRRKRLKLSKITFSDLDYPYIFTYDESVNLPDKMSFATDYWGYYNGQVNAGTFLPDLAKVFVKLPADILPPTGTLGHPPLPPIADPLQDRRANEAYGKAWLLKKIIYPTGGSTEFDYEMHRFTNRELLGVGDATENSAYANWNYYGSPGSISTSGQQSTGFTLNKAQTVKITSNLPLRFSDMPNPGQNVRAEIVNANNVVKYSHSFKDDYPTAPPGETCDKPTKIKYINLDPGTYTVRIVLVGSVISCVHAGQSSSINLSILVNYRTFPDPNNIVSRGGGMRIKTITEKDGTNTVRTKSITYSGGQIMDFPNYYRIHPAFEWTAPVQTVGFERESHMKISYAGAAIRGISQGPVGNYIGYQTVTETLINGEENNGSIRYHFWNTSLDCNNASLAPCSYRVENGLLIQKEILNSTGQRVQLDSNYYEFVDAAQSYGVMGEKVSFGIDYPGLASYIVHSYPLLSIRSRLLLSKTVQYRGDRRFVTQKNYTYNSRHALSTETLTDSDGSVIKMAYKYPQDFVATAPYNTMTNTLNWTDAVVEKKTTALKNSVEGTVVKETNTYTTQPDGDILLENTKTSAQGTDQEVLTIVKYDAKNNPVSVMTRAGVLTSYLYDPTGTYLIAEAVNCASNKFYYTSFEDGTGNSMAGDSKTGTKSKTNGYSYAVMGVQGGNFILSYWKKINGIWQYQEENVYATGDAYYISLTGQVDEVRLYPKEARMTTFTYRLGVGVSTITDPNNISKHYEYDTRNRLVHIKDADGNILKNIEYYFKGNQ